MGNQKSKLQNMEKYWENFVNLHHEIRPQQFPDLITKLKQEHASVQREYVNRDIMVGWGGRLRLISEATIKTNPEVVRDLIRMGADVNFEGPFNPLIIAISRRKVEMVETFLKNGANPNTEFYELKFGSQLNGKPVICYAVKKFREDINDKSIFQIVSLLLDRGVNPNFDYNENHLILDMISLTNDKVFETAMHMIRSGYNINRKDKGGCNVLMHAIHCRNYKIIPELLNRGADIHEEEVQKVLTLLIEYGSKSFEFREVIRKHFERYFEAFCIASISDCLARSHFFESELREYHTLPLIFSYLSFC